MKQEQTNGTICRILKDSVWVAIHSDCLSKEKCHSSCTSCCSQQQTRKITVKTKNVQNFSVGQKVKVNRYVPDEAIIAFIVFGVPILFSVITLLIWFSISPEQIESPIAFFSVAIALVSGFAVVALIDILFRNLFPPVITFLPENSI